ncbi:MAG TPA: SCO family protein [Bacteroidia bacterium]|nr:SCO family protein [Bacteroidia bacterium]
MRTRIAIVAAAAFFVFSCKPKNNDAAGEITDVGGIQRLMIYYPLDSTGPGGEKLYHTISPDTLTGQNGKPFLTASMKGNVVVTDFFFASCGGICPKMTSQLTRVQAAIGKRNGFHIVSYSVDPERDSFPALQQYAERFSADTSMWTFVTGPKKRLYDLARYSYYLPVQPGNGDSEDFIHSDQVVLLDRQMRIRGYYNGTDSTAVDSLITDVKTLLEEK